MLSLNGREVARVRMHGTSYVLNIGNVGPTVDANSAKTVGGLTLTYLDGGCLCRSKSGIEFWISGGNIQLMELMPLEASSQKS